MIIRIKKNSPKRFIIFTLSIIVFRLLLDVCYFSVVSPHFSYEGLIDNRNTSQLILSWLCLAGSTIFLSAIVNDQTSKISNIVVFSVYLMSYVPFTTAIHAGIIESDLVLYNSLYWIVLLVSQSSMNRLPVKPFKRMSLGRVRINDSFVMCFGIISLILVLYISARYTRFRINFNLFSVYDLRREALTYNMPRILTYAFCWTRAINPILMAYCIERKKKYLAVMFAITQVLSFGIDGLKSTLFMIAIVLICAFVSRYGDTKKIKNYVTAGLATITGLSIVENLILKTQHIVTFFIRRMLFIPNYLMECYYDFFKTNPRDFFRGSFLRIFGFSSPYGDSGGISLAIGARYFRSGANCNNGLASDAMTNLGMAGAFIMPILLCIVLRLIDKGSYGKNGIITLVIAFYVSEVIIGTFLATVLITHGVAIIILLLSFMEGNEKPIIDNVAYSGKV